MQTKRYALTLWLALTTCSCYMALGQQLEPQALQHGPRPRTRIRLGDMQSNVQLQRPLNAYNRQIPQVQAPLYAYAPVPPLMAPPPFQPPSSTVHSHIPLLRETSSTEFTPLDARMQEAIVYGNWKQDRPLKPDEVVSTEAQPKERVYGRLQAMLMGIPLDDMSKEAPTEDNKYDISSSYYNPHARRDSFEHSQELYEPVPIPSSTSSTTARTQSNVPEVIVMSANDPVLKAMAKQINESIETTTTRRPKTTEDTWIPMPYPSYPNRSHKTTLSSEEPATSTSLSTAFVPSTLSPTQIIESTSVSLSWPTDFLHTEIASTERIDRKDEGLLDDVDDYKSYEEGTKPGYENTEITIPETLATQTSLNITRMGVPYEEQNASEEPTICVPLTVTEATLPSDNETAVMVEVERVYCFPLPKEDGKTGASNENDNITASNTSPTDIIPKTTTNLTLSTENPSTDNAVAGSNRISLTTCILVLIPALIWHKTLLRR